MWQKCPVCDGTGNDPNSMIAVSIDGPTMSVPMAVSCTVCNGEKIIDRDTGLPPQKSTTVVTLPDLPEGTSVQTRYMVQTKRDF